MGEVLQADGLNSWAHVDQTLLMHASPARLFGLPIRNVQGGGWRVGSLRPGHVIGAGMCLAQQGVRLNGPKCLSFLIYIVKTAFVTMSVLVPLH